MRWRVEWPEGAGTTRDMTTNDLEVARRTADSLVKQAGWAKIWDTQIHRVVYNATGPRAAGLRRKA